MDRMLTAALAPELYPECEPLAPPPEADDEAPHERVARIVRTIEADIIPRLVRAHRLPGAAPPEAANLVHLRADDVGHFVQRVLADDDHGWIQALEAHLARGVGIEEIYLGLLGPTAVELGRMWEEDTATFSDVTVGVGRLQRVMRSLSPAFGHDVAHPADGRRALLIPAPGEAHTFGLTIVAEFFRRAGWEVIGDADARTAEPATLVRQEWFDIIGLSVGVEARLDWLRAGIGAIRHASRNRSIGVMVGGPIFVQQPQRAAEVGADATAIDGRDAPRVAEQLLAERVSRL